MYVDMDGHKAQENSSYTPQYGKFTDYREYTNKALEKENKPQVTYEFIEGTQKKVIGLKAGHEKDSEIIITYNNKKVTFNQVDDKKAYENSDKDNTYYIVDKKAYLDIHRLNNAFGFNDLADYVFICPEIKEDIEKAKETRNKELESILEARRKELEEAKAKELEGGINGSEDLVSKSQLENFFTQIDHFQANYVTDDMIKDLNRVLQKYQINTPERIAMFMATIGHESKTGLVEGGVGNTYVVDGVDYRGGGYSQITGYKYNYKPFADQMAKERLVKLNPDGSNPITSKGGGAQYVAEYFAWEAAGWHWNAQGNTINKRIDDGEDFYKVSQVINGGPSYTGTPNGWNERNQFYGIAQNIFN